VEIFRGDIIVGKAGRMEAMLTSWERGFSGRWGDLIHFSINFGQAYLCADMPNRYQDRVDCAFWSAEGENCALDCRGTTGFEVCL